MSANFASDMCWVSANQFYTPWNLHEITAWKMSKYGVFSGPYFLAFGLNTERYSVSLRIQSEWRKIRARKNSVCGHFSRNEYIVFRWLQMMGPYKVIYSPKFAYYIILEAKFNNPFMLLIELLRRCFALLS